jgi:hypothetical protein
MKTEIQHLKNILKNEDIFKVLASESKQKYKKAILKSADKKLVDDLCEIIYNILIGNLSLNETEFKLLNNYKNNLRKLINKSSLKAKKKILVQKGSGFLPLIIPAAITGISSIISSLISKSNQSTE